MDASNVHPVVIHVRLGDFKVLGWALSAEWYREALLQIRRQLGYEIPAHVISDSSDNDLQELLNLAQVTRLSTGSAIGDLWLLSKAHVIVANGLSSFAAWAVFLGQTRAVVQTGASLRRWRLAPADDVDDEWEVDRPLPMSLLQELSSRTATEVSKKP